MTFKNVQIFHQNSIIVAETHVYLHQTIDTKLSSATKQCAFGIRISK